MASSEPTATGESCSPLPMLSQLIGSDETMRALFDVFRQYPGGMSFEVFSSTMQSFFPEVFPTPEARPLVTTSDVSLAEANGANGEVPKRFVSGNIDEVQYASLNLRQRRLLAQMELAGVVESDPLRVLFNQMDTHNTFSVDWVDFIGYVVEEASSAGVFSMVKNEYRAYSHARTRHGESLPDMSPAGDVRYANTGDLFASRQAGIHGSADEDAGGLAASDQQSRRAAAMEAAKQERKRRRLLQHVWRGHLNKYGGKLVARERTAPASTLGTHPAGSSTTDAALSQTLRQLQRAHEVKDLSQILFMDALPTNPVAFAVSCRHLPLSLYHKATFRLMKTFSEADLGGVAPTLVTYVASSDTLLVYSSLDGCVRGFSGLFTTSHMSSTAVYHVSAGLLCNWRQRPTAMPEMLFIGGSYGSVHQIHVPRGLREQEDLTAASGKEENSPGWRPRQQRVAADRDAAPSRALRLVRSFDHLHSHESGGVIDFVMSDTHLFSCGFDHRIVSTTLSTGTRIVIGCPDEAISSLGFHATMQVVVAAAATSSELYLWDARAVTTVPGTRFGCGEVDTTGGGLGSGGGGTGSRQNPSARIIGIECPEDMPHAVTADDTGMVRVWDLRSRMCVQHLRADGLRDQADEEDAEVVYGNQVKSSADDEDQAKFSRAMQLKAQANRAKHLDALVSVSRPPFSVRTAKGAAGTDIGVSPERFSRGGGAAAASLPTRLGNRLQTVPTMRTPCDSTKAAATAVPPRPSSVLVSLAYFSTTHEIVTCTADTIFTLQHNQREDPNRCDIDYVVGIFHAIREGNQRTGTTHATGQHPTSRQGRGSLLLQGPSRLTLWDAAGGYRTRLVDRALVSAVPHNRKEVVALCLDDVGNRVFLSFPDGSLEVHDLAAVFDMAGITTGAGLGDVASATAGLDSGCTIVPGATAPPGGDWCSQRGRGHGDGAPASSTWPPEVVTELVYLSDQKLLCGATTKGRLLLRSEDDSNAFFAFVCPTASELPLSHLTVSGELGLLAAASASGRRHESAPATLVHDDDDIHHYQLTPNSPSVQLSRSQHEGSPYHLGLSSELFGNMVMTPSDGKSGNSSNSTRKGVEAGLSKERAQCPSSSPSYADQQYCVYLYDYRHAGVMLNPPTVLRISRTIEKMLFLGALPLLLTVHDGGDLLLWSCPPVQGGVFPIIGMNVFTSGRLARTVPHEQVGATKGRPLSTTSAAAGRRKKRSHAPTDADSTAVPVVGNVTRPGTAATGSTTAMTSPQQASPRVGRPPSRPLGRGGSSLTTKRSSWTPPEPVSVSSPSFATTPIVKAATEALANVYESSVPSSSLSSPRLMRTSSSRRHSQITAPTAASLSRRGSFVSRRSERPKKSPVRKSILAGEAPRPVDLQSLAADQHVTCVAFDPRTHRLFCGDSRGNVFVYSLCPTIQAYGVRACQFESRRAYHLRSHSMNATAAAMPLLVACRDIHGVQTAPQVVKSSANSGLLGTAFPGAVGRQQHHKSGSGGGSGSGVIALAWLPFLQVLLSSGEDHRVVLLDVDGNPLGSLSAARLPASASMLSDEPALAPHSRGQGEGEPEREARGGPRVQLPAYDLPSVPVFDARRALHLDGGAAQAPQHHGCPGHRNSTSSDDGADACRSQQCVRHGTNSQACSPTCSSRPNSATSPVQRSKSRTLASCREVTQDRTSTAAPSARSRLGDELPRSAALTGATNLASPPPAPSATVPQRGAKVRGDKTSAGRRVATPREVRGISTVALAHRAANTTGVGDGLLKPVLTLKDRPARELRQQARARNHYAVGADGLNDDDDDDGGNGRCGGLSDLPVHLRQDGEKTYAVTDRTLCSFTEQRRQKERPSTATTAATAKLSLPPSHHAVAQDEARVSQRRTSSTTSEEAEQDEAERKPHGGCDEPVEISPPTALSSPTGPAISSDDSLPLLRSSPSATGSPFPETLDAPKLMIPPLRGERTRQPRATSPGLAVKGCPALSAGVAFLPERGTRRVDRAVHEKRSGRPAPRSTAAASPSTMGNRAPLGERGIAETIDKSPRKVLPGTSEALQMRLEEYEKELKRCLKGNSALRRATDHPSKGLLKCSTPFS